MDAYKKVRFPIGAKLLLIISTLVILSVGSLTLLVSYFITADVRITAENTNFTINSRSAQSVEAAFTTVQSNVSLMLDLLQTMGADSLFGRRSVNSFFEHNDQVAAVIMVAPDKISDDTVNYELRLVNNQFFLVNELEESYLDYFIEAEHDRVAAAARGETDACNASPYFDRPMLSLLYYRQNGEGKPCAVIILFAGDSIGESFGSGTTNTTFMINSTGDVLVHPDFELVRSSANISHSPLVIEMRRNNDKNRQIMYTDVNGEGSEEQWFGAYQKLAIADIGVCTVIRADTVFEAINYTTRNNILLGCAILCLFIVLVSTFSYVVISRPLTHLTLAIEQITSGNFNTERITNLNVRRHDEIGVLNYGVQNERRFLNVFARFTNQNVAKAIASNTIDFDPHLKDCTIFFSDIRGFTAISDDFKKRFGANSAGEIIGFLNDYMERMVRCVTLSGGTVDKFEGDAIMAVWGILRNDDLSFENLPDTAPEKKKKKFDHLFNVMEDTVNCIRATLAMRYALMQYNKDAAAFVKAHEHESNAKYKPHIRIGCGINTGRITAGVMGSEYKMEYTAIGDAVNLASRTESSNKACGTDILITEATYTMLKHFYIKSKYNNYTLQQPYAQNEIVVEKIPVTFNVKGKGEQHFYGVVNMPHFDVCKFFTEGEFADPDFVFDAECGKAVGPQGPKTLNEVRTLLGIPKPDFTTVDLNADEQKSQIKK